MTITGWLSRRRKEWTRWYYIEEPDDVDDDIAEGRGLLLNLVGVPVVSAGVATGEVDPVLGSLFIALELAVVAGVWDKLRDLDD